jgi:hypothetical protein
MPEQTKTPVAERRAARKARDEQRWATRYAAAATPAALAGVEFDRLRAALTKLGKRDPAAAERVWRDLFALLRSTRESRAVSARHGTGAARR